jgi:predicted membrane GTPase involved in stress response
MDFPTIYTSALNGTSGLDLEKIEEDMSPLLDLIISKVR